jgi:hypothetical protein
MSDPTTYDHPRTLLILVALSLVLLASTIYQTRRQSFAPPQAFGEHHRSPGRCVLQSSARCAENSGRLIRHEPLGNVTLRPECGDGVSFTQLRLTTAHPQPQCNGVRADQSAAGPRPVFLGTRYDWPDAEMHAVARVGAIEKFQRATKL